MRRTADVVIIGGGVIGCALASALCQRSASVIVIEQGTIGMQASSAASGMLAPLKPFAKPDDPYTQLLLGSLKRFPSFVAEIEAISGINVKYEPTGSLRLLSPKQLPRVEKWVTQWRQFGSPITVLQGEDIQHCEPALSLQEQIAVYHSGEPQLSAPQLMRGLACAAERQGAVFAPQEAVAALSHNENVIQAVHTSWGKTISCGHLVLATGAWAASSGKWLGLELPVRPIRAQSVALRQPPTPIRHLIFGKGIYLAPKSKQTLIVGVARDEVGFDVQTTPEGIAWLCETAQKLVPTLDPFASREAWAGLLPATPDARPILGPAPGWKNVTLACGYNGYGLLLSAHTADLLAEHILSGQVPDEICPFLFTRFSARKEEK